MTVNSLPFNSAATHFLRNAIFSGAVVSSVDLPVNVLAAVPGASFTLDDLSKLGVKRVSVGSVLSSAAYGAAIRAAQEIRAHGTFTYTNQAISFHDVSNIFKS